MWSRFNPHLIRAQEHEESWSVNVWVGILGDRLFGPYLLLEWHPGHSYLIFLRNVLSEFLDGIPLGQYKAFGSNTMELWCISVLLYVIGWIWNTHGTPWESSFVAVKIALSCTGGFFPMGPSQVIGVSRNSNYINELNRLSACCLYFYGHRTAAM
ncbi:hypothetical protein HNY73_004893 [Argiope bruennichi]|uniref:Uncharacterized protein n=1 Tax=Argiope bruennichi TaxID=94029 RepID=A0A8T0FQM6_ARGBR|nr:hypothetical protein HNY73_004893 [Argiope bruennichi]